MDSNPAYQIIAASKPDPPISFVRNEALTTKTQVAFSWSEPVSNGGSPVIDYLIEFDNSLGTFSKIEEFYTSTSFVKTGLQEGTSYKFRVQARNAVDYSIYSQEFAIIAATVPGKPNAPSTTVSGDEETIVIDWTAPTNTGGLDVSGYKLYVQKADLTWAEESTSCDA